LHHIDYDRRKGLRIFGMKITLLALCSGYQGLPDIAPVITMQAFQYITKAIMGTGIVLWFLLVTKASGHATLRARGFI
jgi:hypothetical protein